MALDDRVHVVDRERRPHVEIDTLVDRAEDRDRESVIGLPCDVAAVHSHAPIELFETFVRAARQQRIVNGSANAQLIVALHTIDRRVPGSQIGKRRRDNRSQSRLSSKQVTGRAADDERQEDDGRKQRLQYTHGSSAIDVASQSIAALQ